MRSFQMQTGEQPYKGQSLDDDERLTADDLLCKDSYFVQGLQNLDAGFSKTILAAAEQRDDSGLQRSQLHLQQLQAKERRGKSWHPCLTRIRSSADQKAPVLHMHLESGTSRFGTSRFSFFTQNSPAPTKSGTGYTCAYAGLVQSQRSHSCAQQLDSRALYEVHLQG